ncbi:MAG: DUF2442 domain-containing protein [Lachnospiraceae bacterium]|nr:DUF2442 domain-containing protein [Lachnospiraceae bacterium]
MFIVDGIAYASEKTDDLRATDVRVLDGHIMIVTFSTGEERLVDVTELFSVPAFRALKDETVFRTATIDFGTVVWKNGEIDIGADTLYDRSYPYERKKVIA